MTVPSGRELTLLNERVIQPTRRVQLTVEKLMQFCAAIAAFVFLVTGVVYIYVDSWTVTHADFWGIYEFYFDHSWLETAVFKHNDHSHFFPSFFWLASVKFFHGSQQPLVFTGLALLLITTVLLLKSVWHDKTIGLSEKIAATLVVIAGNFWMGRNAVTMSGGFNSVNSLLTAALVLSLLLIPKVSWYWWMVPILVCTGFIASFSFGTGFAIWPTLLLLAWCLRLRWLSIVAIGISTFAAIIVYKLLPPQGVVFRAVDSETVVTAMSYLCRLIGSPIAYATAAWHGGDEFMNSDHASTLALWSGIIGLVLTGIALIPRAVCRDLGKSGLEITGLGLVIFNVGATAVIVIGRMEYFHDLPSDVMAPRYLFWSSLFWTGLLLTGIQRAGHLRWSRWPLVAFALAAAVFAWPAHYHEGFWGKFAERIGEKAATALINGAVDDSERILADRTQIARVTPYLQANGLDMFTEGLQDWIGLEKRSLFGGRHKREGLKGQCSVEALVQCDNGTPAARIVGTAVKKRRPNPIARWATTPVSWIFGPEIKKGYVITPMTLVIVDPTGVVRGVARSLRVSPFINRVFYQGKFNTTGFVGYIHDYDPQLPYVVCSADGVLSDEKIPVQIPNIDNAKP